MSASRSQRTFSFLFALCQERKLLHGRFVINREQVKDTMERIIKKAAQAA